MKIAVNTRFLLEGQLEGIGIYTQEIFRRVVRLLPQHEFYFLFDRKPAPEFIFADNVKAVIVSPQARHPLLWYWWFEHAVPAVLKKYQIDVFLSPDGYGSLNTDIPQIITIHDLAFEHYPEQVPFLVNQYYRYFVPKYCAKASKILTVSEFTKKDIIANYAIPAEKIEVVYNGFDLPEFTTAANGTTDSTPYFMFIGAIHPRKNVLGLLKAFEQFKSKYHLPHKIKIAGRKAWMNKELDAFFNQMHYKADVEWISTTDRSALMLMLKHAQALVFPGFFEGFGIPILEAMSLGVPVITSDLSAMPEVAGDAALLISPHEPAAIAEAMFQLATDELTRNECIRKGTVRAAVFSWDKSAQQVAALIEQFSS